MAKRKMLDKLIPFKSISEEMRLIEGSDTDYITPTGKIYKDYGNGLFFPKATHINNKNGYLYCGITCDDGQQRNKRVHILVAKAYLPNPNNYQVVMHKDNNKANPVLENLEWGTAQKNTQNAYNDGLARNAKSWEDSQSIPVCAFRFDTTLIDEYGSVGDCSRQLGVTKTAILNQCNHNVKTKPRSGYYFRYLSEYKEKGFVL